jgi:lipopolysaccharide transport system permease protein
MLKNLYLTPLNEGVRTRKLWIFLANAKTKARFSRSILGSLWMGLSNLLSVGVLSVIYGYVFKVPDTITYLVYLSIGYSLWQILSGVISSAPTIFESNRHLLHNTNAPLVVFLLEEWFYNLQSAVQSLLPVLVIAIVLKPMLLSHFFQFAPCIVNFLVFILWLPCLLSVVGTRFQDFYQLLPIILQLSFLSSPILYYAEALPANVRPFLHVNIFYLYLSQARDSLISGSISGNFFILLFFINIAGIAVSCICLHVFSNKIKFYL